MSLSPWAAEAARRELCGHFGLRVRNRNGGETRSPGSHSGHGAETQEPLSCPDVTCVTLRPCEETWSGRGLPVDTAHSGWNQCEDQQADGPVPPGGVTEAPHWAAWRQQGTDWPQGGAAPPFSTGSLNGVRKHSLGVGHRVPW